MPVLCAAMFMMLSITARDAPDDDIAGQLDAICGEYSARRDVASLVALDGKLRNLLHKPWRQAKKSADGRIWKPSWSAIGVEVGHYSESLEYSGKLLVQAHQMNPSSEYRQFTLFAAVMGERPSHGLGEMPNLEMARQYLKEFPQGPFAADVSIILGNFYSDLFKVIKHLQQDLQRDYKSDCFAKHVDQSSLVGQAASAQRLSIAYYARALALLPAKWAETRDVAHWRIVMQGGDLRAIDALGWHFCAD